MILYKMENQNREIFKAVDGFDNYENKIKQYKK